MIPVGIVPGTSQRYPGIGVFVPKLTNLFVVHRSPNALLRFQCEHTVYARFLLDPTVENRSGVIPTLHPTHVMSAAKIVLVWVGVIIGFPLVLLLLVGSCSAIERHFMSRDADSFCDQFEIGTSTYTDVLGVVGAAAMESSYINQEWGYRFRWWDALGVSAEACSLWFENGKLVKKRRHGDLG